MSLFPSYVPPLQVRWIGTVLIGTFLGGILFALIAWGFQKNDLALGFFWGGMLSSANFYALNILTTRVLGTGQRGQRGFWVWNLLRLGVLAVVYWFLLRVSVFCLLGALGSYFGFLGVLGWVGWRTAAFSKTS
jgi:hypothetical protein